MAKGLAEEHLIVKAGFAKHRGFDQMDSLQGHRRPYNNADSQSESMRTKCNHGKY